jgi:hypothetical protein
VVAGQSIALPSRSGLRRLFSIVGGMLVYLVAALFSAWAAMALFFDLPTAKLRLPAATVYLLGTLALFLLLRRPGRCLGACLVTFACVSIWWFQLKPSNDGPWQADVSRTAWAEVHGSQVVIHNFRSCDYRAELDYTCAWPTVSVDLNQIQGVDLFVDYWGSSWIAHTILSFDLEDGRHIAFSIETRKRPGQTYSSVRGFFRQYTLISVVSDERDVVRLRTNYRHGENLYLFHTKSTPAFSRSLFLNYIGFTNGLHDKPEWYNAVTHNCTTEIYSFSTMKGQPWSWRILFNGKLPQLEYWRGELAGNLPWPELMRRAYINPAAHAANDSPNFSALIRANRPGFEVDSSSRKFAFWDRTKVTVFLKCPSLFPKES